MFSPYTLAELKADTKTILKCWIKMGVEKKRKKEMHNSPNKILVMQKEKKMTKLWEKQTVKHNMNLEDSRYEA